MSNDNTQANFSVFLDKIKFNSYEDMVKFIENADGPELIQMVTNIFETANKNGAFTLGESAIVGETLKRLNGVLSMFKRKED
jgi:hypothetical protein